jgi:iron(III) transport system permease protein
VISDPTFLTSLRNTFALAVSTSVIATAAYTLVAYVSVRTTFRGRGLLEFLAWLPASLPGIILGLGLLWMFLGTPPLRTLYGTISALVLAVLVAHMTLGVQTIKGPLVQIGTDLEEAARVIGASWWTILRHVVLPLIAPALVLVAAISFVLAARDVSTVALLATSSSSPLALLQLQYMTGGHYESAAVIGVIVVVLTTGVALVARGFASRFGLGLN